MIYCITLLFPKTGRKKGTLGLYSRDNLIDDAQKNKQQQQPQKQKNKQ